MLGDNTITNRSSPVQVGSLTTWKTISSTYFSTAAIKIDGSLWAWGYNGDGILGDNTVVNKSSPIQVGSDYNWYAVTCGALNIYAIKTNNTLWSWGSNAYGQLGHNNTAGTNSRSSPVQVGALTTWLALSRGAYTYVHAIKSA